MVSITSVTDRSSKRPMIGFNMKLFKQDILTEGKIFSDDAFIVYGKMIDYQGKENGWYILFNFKFIRKMVKNYMNPETFLTCEQKCYYRYLIMRRKPLHSSSFVYRLGIWNKIN